MILESYPWKQELHSICKALKELPPLGDCYDEDAEEDFPLFDIEKNVFLAAFIIRKLLESRKLTTKALAAVLPVKSYRPFVEIVTWRERFSPEECYDLDNPEPQKISLKTLCNQIIHSFVFVHQFTGTGKLKGFWFASDWQKSKRLFYITKGQLLKAIEAVANDESAASTMIYNSKKKDWDVINFPNTAKVRRDLGKFYEVMKKKG